MSKPAPAAGTPGDVQAMNAEVRKFQEMESELQSHAQSRAALMTQLNENMMVEVELKALSDDAQVFKKIGPVLLPQDRTEAEANVQKRLEFIRAELGRVEKQVKDTQQAAQAQQQKVVAMQQALQQHTQQAAAQGGAGKPQPKSA